MDDRQGLDKRAGGSNLEVADKLVAVGRRREGGIAEIAAANWAVDSILAVVLVVVVVVVVVVEGFLDNRDLAYVDYADSWCLP